VLPLSLLVIAVLAAYAASLAILVRRTPVLLPGPRLEGDVPFVSIVVPARNEERIIEGCIAGLMAQDYPAFEVIVVDDNSSDATPQLLERSARRFDRLRVVTGAPLPPGWFGKSFALTQGVRAARGEWLLFIDADVKLSAGALTAAYRCATAQRVSLVTAWPRHDLRTFWERVVQRVVIALHYFGEFVVRLRRPWGVSAGPGIGQFILMSRASHEAIGGHEGVRDVMCEDRILVQRVREHGFDTVTVSGAELMQVRMYTSLREMWAGWSKNAFDSMQYGLAELLGAVIAVVLVSVGPLAATAWAAAAALSGSGSAAVPLALAAASWGLLGLASLLLRPFLPVPFGYLLTFPLGGLVLVAILVNSTYRHYAGLGMQWKGRSYPAAREQAVEPRR
jgi:chlorobactene glucosyltransferase